MSDMGLEAPDADAAEQRQGAVPEAENGDAVVTQPPLEANEADAAEQDKEVDAADDDEYR